VQITFSGIETLFSLVSNSNSSISQIFYVCLLGIAVWNIMLVVTYAYNMILFAIFTVSKIVSGFLSLFQILLDLSSGKTFQEELK
jgi:hypothetical protein